MAFGNGKSGTIVGIGIGELLSHFIDNVCLVDGLKHNLLSVSPVSYTHLTLPTKRIV